MQPQLILWDIGNVIVLADHAITHRILREYGVAEENAKKFFANEEYKDYARGKITGQDFYRALIEKYLKLPLTYDQVMHAHDEHMYGIDEAVVKILDTLAAHEKKMAFFTNTVTWQTLRERELIDVGEYFGPVFRSNEIGMIKADKNAFPYVVSQLGMPAEQILFIDDSEGNVEMARKYGLQAHQFKDAARLRTALQEQKLLEELK